MKAIGNFDRYRRQWILPEIGISGQEKLARATVLVVGAGGLGCAALQYLAAAGIGKLIIVDFDTVDLTNLQRQILYSVDDIGKQKATTAAEKLRRLNPEICIEPINEKLEDSNATTLMSGVDIVIDGSDNFSTRYLIDAYCAKLDKPLVYGSIFRFEGQVSVFHYKGSPGLISIYPGPPEEDEQLSCAEIGVVGALPGMVGSIQALETIKIITGAGEVLAGKLWVWNTLTTQPQVLTFWEKEADPLIDLYNNSQGVTKCELHELKTKYPDLRIIDVREPYEFEAINIGGENIPLGSFTERDWADSEPIVLVCSSGQRSKMALNWLSTNFPAVNSFHLAEGIGEQ